MSGTSVENREAQRKSLIKTLQSCLRKPLTNYGEAKEVQQMPKPKEPLNNRLCPVPTQCISRYLHLVKVI